MELTFILLAKGAMLPTEMKTVFAIILGFLLVCLVLLIWYSRQISQQPTIARQDGSIISK
jgi:hypothetical protein